MFIVVSKCLARFLLKGWRGLTQDTKEYQMEMMIAAAGLTAMMLVSLGLQRVAVTVKK